VPKRRGRNRVRACAEVVRRALVRVERDIERAPRVRVARQRIELSARQAIRRIVRRERSSHRGADPKIDPERGPDPPRRGDVLGASPLPFGAGQEIADAGREPRAHVPFLVVSP
jgi:hypothetical protein